MMHRRLPHSLALALSALALFATTASAKQIVGAQICGADGCTTVRGAALNILVNGGPPTDPPKGAAPFYEARITIETEKGHRETFKNAFVPAYGLTRGGDGTWMHTLPPAEAVFKRAARGLTAFPASDLGPIPSPTQARVVEVVTPPADPAPVRDDGSWWLIASLGLAGVLTVWGLARYALRRGGRGSSPAAPTPPGP
jgi:hypothetical protein